MRKRLLELTVPRRTAGFTLVEILLVCAVVGLLIAGSLDALRRFRRAFDSGEQNTALLREITFFEEYLRRDLANAAPPLDPPGQTFRAAITCTGSELTFPAFVDEEGTIARITYQTEGGNLRRIVGPGRPQVLITEGLASLSWTLHEDGRNRVSGFQAGRIWIHLEAGMGKPDGHGGQVEIFRLSTNLFPVRWNRTVHRHPQASR